MLEENDPLKTPEELSEAQKSPAPSKSTPEVLSQEEKERIAGRLKERITRWICPMCNTNQWELLDGYFSLLVSKNLQQIQIGPISVPSTAIICKHCGHISIHALGVLGLMEKSGDENVPGA